MVEFKALADGSRQGRDAGLGHGVFKAPVASHVVFYRVAGGDVEIIRILHKAMDFSQHLAG